MGIFSLPSRLIESTLYHLSVRRLAGGSADHAATATVGDYAGWREARHLRNWTDNFGPAYVRGKRVLDFACGTGPLSFLVREQGAASVVGVDLNETVLAVARKEAERRGVQGAVTFRVGRVDGVPLPDSSVDVILCFTVMEHVMEPAAVLRDWFRVLAPGGRAIVWWSGWPHPYGHEMDRLMPVPWVHLVLPWPVLCRVAKRVYDSPHYRPRFWDMDAEGRKKPYPFAGERVPGWLNRLWPHQFERLAAGAGLRVVRRAFRPFGGRRLRWLKRGLAKLPRVGACFASVVVYELEKPSQPQAVPAVEWSIASAPP